jgi:hypothetical protein
MVVPLVVPNARTVSPVVTASADVEFAPSWYVVEDVSSTVTFWPADVIIVKPDVDTLSTVPDAPPVAGPDRALGAASRDPLLPAMLPPGAGFAAVVERDVTMPTESPMSAHASAAAAAIHRRLREGGLEVGTGADDSEVALEAGRPPRVSLGFVDP